MWVRPGVSTIKHYAGVNSAESGGILKINTIKTFGVFSTIFGVNFPPKLAEIVPDHFTGGNFATTLFHRYLACSHQFNWLINIHKTENKEKLFSWYRKTFIFTNSDVNGNMLKCLNRHWIKKQENYAKIFQFFMVLNPYLRFVSSKFFGTKVICSILMQVYFNCLA